jgi:hypothetical protein
MYVTERVKKREKRREKLFDLKIHFSRYFYMAVTCRWSRFYASLGCYLLLETSQQRKGALRVFKLLLILDLSHFAMAVYVTLEVFLR